MANTMQGAIMVETKPLAHGIYPYLPSPITADGNVGVDVLKRLVGDLIDDGIHGVTPLGTTGEVTYLSFEQRTKIVSSVVDAAGGRVPVVAGLSAFSTRDAVRQAVAFEELGADGLVVMRQQALPTTDDGIVEYFREVAEHVSVPIVLYTNPSVLGTDLSIAVLRELATVPNIRYLKDATGITGRILNVIEQLGDEIDVFSASAHIPLVVFDLGGIGWMAGPACVIPRQSVALYDAWRHGERDAAWRLQRSMWPINELFARHGLAACIKAALEIRGYRIGPPIHPQHPLADGAINDINNALERADTALDRHRHQENP